MDAESLTAKQQQDGRRSYQVFQVFNVLSFTMLSGSVISLFALRLGANSFFIGVLSSLMSLALIFMIIGRQIVEKIGTRRQFALSWLLRNFCMIPVAFAPLLSTSGRTTAAMLVIFFGLLGFNFFKGIGLVSMNPIVGALSEGRDRGEFLARLQIYVHIVLVLTNLFIGFFLGPDAPITKYLILITTGIVMGIFSSVFIFKLPDIERKRESKQSSLLDGIKQGLRRPEIRRFISFAFLVAFITGISNPFVIVFAKKVYGISDNGVIFFLVLGNAGVISMGLIARILIDRLGPKPLYLLFLSTLALSVIPIVVAPSIAAPWSFLFLGAVFFFYNFGMMGGTNSAQTYFFAITDATEHLNLGILYYVAGGTAGTLGSLVGGFMLTSLEGVAGSEVNAFRILYSFVLLMLVLCVVLIGKLKDTGQFSVRKALEVFFSRKDLKAVVALHKLDNTQSEREEVAIIDSLADANSEVPLEELLSRLKSPRFYIRSRVLRTLETLPDNEKVHKALIGEIENHAFTTAHVAARIMGRKGIREGIHVLRHSLSTDDYLLQAESILALARLGDRESVSRIERILVDTSNPMVRIYSASALDIFSEASSIPALFNSLEQVNSPPHVRDELILSLSGILGFSEWFYPFFSEFLKRGRRGLNMLRDYLDDHCPGDCSTLGGAVSDLMKDRAGFSEKYQAWYAAFQTVDWTDSLHLFDEIMRHEELVKLDRLMFLAAAFAVYSVCSEPD